MSFLIWLRVILGIITVIAGAIFTPLPTPWGIPMMIFGLWMASAHPRIMNWIRAARAKFPKVSQKLADITPKFPHFMQDFLHRTAQSADSPYDPSLDDQHMGDNGGYPVKPDH